MTAARGALCRRLAPRLLMASLLLAAAAPAASAEPRFVACDAAGVRVAASNARDRANACAGARDALGFFAASGLPRTEPIAIEVVPRLPEAAGITAVGAYVHSRRRIFVLGYAALARRGRWFQVPIDRKAQRSIVVHEVAHALSACNDGWFDMSWHGKEYVASVAMFATMDPLLREGILRAVPGTGFETIREITPLSLAFYPENFAADAYRHYLRPDNGAAFVRGVVEGHALTE
jgi:hypothetical protein